jgi:hypothetical protein
MKNFLHFFFLSMLVPASLFTQTTNAEAPAPAPKATNEDLLEWSPERKLTWEDYHGEPERNSDAVASTTTYLGIEYNIKSDQFSFTINSRFSKDRSWGTHRTPYILSHEQGHFDIAEVYARILYARMSQYKFNRKTYAKDLKAIYDEVILVKEEMQERYDTETNHSIFKVRQAEWLKKIEGMLEATKDWAGY